MFELKGNTIVIKEKCPDGDCYTYCGETRTENEPQCPHCKGSGHTYQELKEPEKPIFSNDNYETEKEAYKILEEHYNEVKRLLELNAGWETYLCDEDKHCEDSACTDIKAKIQENETRLEELYKEHTTANCAQ